MGRVRTRFGAGGRKIRTSGAVSTAVIVGTVLSAPHIGAVYGASIASTVIGPPTVGSSSFTEITSSSVSTIPAYVPMTTEPSWGYFINGGANSQSATFHGSGGWNNQGYIRFTLPISNPDTYSGFGSLNLSSAQNRLHVGWLFRVGSTLTENDTSAGFKHMIAISSDPDEDPRAILLFHSSVDPDWDIAYGNNIDDQPFVGSPNFTAGFNLSQHENEWLWFETQTCASGASPNTHRFWITCSSSGGAHTFAETLISSVVSAQSFPWNQIQIIGSYGGRTPSAAGPNDWFDIGQIYVSNTYIGPPAGF